LIVFHRLLSLALFGESLSKALMGLSILRLNPQSLSEVVNRLVNAKNKDRIADIGSGL
jgi:hypothetical protein